MFKPILFCLMLAPGGSGIGQTAKTPEADNPPDIVLFLSDDHGYLDSSTYGSQVARTPNLDRIAAEGTKFTHTFVGTPSCAPSRAVLYSGLMPARNGAEPNHSSIRAGIKTLPAYMKALGYRVVLFGKRHVKPQEQYDFEFIDSNIRHGPLDIDLDTGAVERFLASRQDQKPLCMIVCSHSPHVYWPENSGYNPARVELPPTFVDTPETREYRTRYYTDVTLMDQRLGEVYDSVKRHLGDNTLFIYTSDHGAQWPFGKWNLYDAGIRVPMLAVWPGVLDGGSVSEAMISLVDFLPTFIELGGGRPPEDLDGHSFAALLKSEKSDHRGEIFATHSGDGDMNVYPIRCIRTKTHKYILNLHPEFKYTTHIDKGKNEDGLKFWRSWEKKALNDPSARQIVDRYHRRPREELYDLTRDPHEMNNLADDQAYREILGELRARLETWMKNQGDQGRVYGKPEALAALKPNIIFILIDDMGYGDLSSYGNQDVQTENIDRLAAEGVHFTQFYVNSPICSPSRVAFTTGQYPARHLIHSYLDSRAKNRLRGVADFLDPQAPAIARTFKQTGYATAHFGKWHMGGGRDVGDAPLPSAYGFNESLVSFEGLGDRVLPPGRLSEQSEDLGRGHIFHAPKHQLTEIYVSRSIEFIKANREQPFYLHLWLNDVHDWHQPRKDYLQKYERFNDNPYLQSFYAVLDHMDEEIGRLMDAIDSLGLAQKTLIVLASDNGPTAWPRYYREGFDPPGSTGGFRGRKWSLYEGGIRMPLIVRWKGVVPAGRINRETVLAAVDFFPTFCQLAGIQPPNLEFDGEDLSQAFLGKSQIRRKPLFWEYGRNDLFLYPGRDHDRSPNLALRQGPWKLLINDDGSRLELYNFSRDTSEEDNLAEERPDVAGRLSEKLLAWRNSLPR